VALKQIKKLLEADPKFSRWLKNPPFPYVKPNNPILMLDRKKGELVYRCPKITDGMKDGCYHLENLVFWEFTAPEPTIAGAKRTREAEEKSAFEKEKELEKQSSTASENLEGCDESDVEKERLTKRQKR
jgi:hypothetical protein